MPDLVIHDEHGFTQTMRRAVLLLTMDQAIDAAALQGCTMTYTEEPDGVTLYVEGVFDSRITYAELAHVEAHPEDLP